jgi:Fic family protein
VRVPGNVFREKLKRNEAVKTYIRLREFLERQAVRELVEKMLEGGLAAKTIVNYVQVAKLVVASAVNDEGERVYPRTWNHDFIQLPIVRKDKQHRPTVGGTRPGNAAFVQPPPEKMMECMGAFEKFLHREHEELPILVKAALVHVQFETIHPFLDGNGRLGRLLITFLLCVAGAIRERRGRGER